MVAESGPKLVEKNEVGADDVVIVTAQASLTTYHLMTATKLC